MARIEKTVFISYRRTDVYTALAVYENLKNQGYDVFFDYRSISSGDFEQIITSNIRARAHFLLILTSTALDRCNEPGDWLRREIELAIDEKRNIVPLFFKGFRFGISSVSEKLTGKLKNLSRYNGLNIHEDYFDEAMHRLSVQYLNIPLDTVLHPLSTEVQKVVYAEQVAANQALEQIEDVQQLVKHDEKPVQLIEPDPMPTLKASAPVATSTEKQAEILRENVADPKPDPKKKKFDRLVSQNLPKQKISIPNLNYRLIGGITGGALLLVLFIWGGMKVFKNTPTTPFTSTLNSQAVATPTSRSVATNTPSPTQMLASPALEFGIGSTMTGNDGMTLLYVPAGEFTMGSEISSDEQPVHQVYLDSYWIDKTEVTNSMYILCVDAGVCNEHANKSSVSRSSYYGTAKYDNYPVIFVDWNMAKTYCEWADRRLPSEAEWEKAARGLDGRTYPWGEKIDCSLANYWGNGTSHCAGDTDEVGSYPNGASIYGALDMAGNVSEWVGDYYSDSYYQNTLASNPLGPDSGQFRLLRGGSWLFGGGDVRSADRFMNDPSRSNTYFGFRCATDAE